MRLQGAAEADGAEATEDGEEEEDVSLISHFLE